MEQNSRVWLSVAKAAASEQGQDLIEYALLAAFIGLVAIGAISTLSTSMDGAVDAMAESVESSSGGGS